MSEGYSEKGNPWDKFDKLIHSPISMEMMSLELFKMYKVSANDLLYTLSYYFCRKENALKNIMYFK